ncbi:MAG: glutamine-hydrolyzing carbamoyl-phosphate synthase small subunit [Gammaproteobacteria bacterium]|nr:glutamine-hydrolyzing carbamoyl-phosphate synthase small subunit [Gammaproteobacteria bacterium]
MVIDAVLALADGTLFRGQSIGATGKTSGEVVFNTALTGYQEILSDPSYSRQIVTLTYPHIGNVGTNAADMESARAFAAGLVIRDLPPRASNYRMQQTLPQFLAREGLVAIADIDTRKLTRILREGGAQSGCIVAGSGKESLADLEQAALAGARAFPGLKGMDLAKVVTTPTQFKWTAGSNFDAPPPRDAAHQRFRVVACDYGVKYNILRLLIDAGCEVTVVPAQTSVTDILALAPEGVFLSNGPGDPEPCDYAIATIKELLQRDLPIFGICLGHQLLGLASGARTIKMKFGHHGANHPVQDLQTGRVLITSQNHGFAIDDTTLPANLVATHRSLFDGSLQGVARTDRDAFSFQGHPEASPGPHDVKYLFERFTAAMQRRRAA